MQNSDELKRKLKIRKFSLGDSGSYILNSKGHTLTSSLGQKTVSVYDRIGPDFQVILNESKIVW